MYQLGLFAKFWQPGKVKTRLAADVGPLAASRIYKVFLKHLVKRVPDDIGNRWIVYSPSAHLADFEAMVKSTQTSNYRFVPQCDGDLGMRMSQFFATAFDEDLESDPEQRRVIVIGSDTPTLTTQQIFKVEQLLSGHQVVLGPATDGGYYLIAMRDGPNRETLLEVFQGIDWSTPKVYQQTIDALEDRLISHASINPMTDVDQFGDLLTLVAQLRQSDVAADQDLLTQLLKVDTDEQFGGFPE